jgi:hypothetical protein
MYKELANIAPKRKAVEVAGKDSDPASLEIRANWRTSQLNKFARITT